MASLSNIGVAVLLISSLRTNLEGSDLNRTYVTECPCCIKTDGLRKLVADALLHCVCRNGFADSR